jgi:1-deoxy-D-xylulose-5-phosphate reductoisomerase
MTAQSGRPKRLALLGATGSIGRQVCDLVERHPERFELHALVAGRDREALERAARAHPRARRLLAYPGDGEDAAAAAAIDDAVCDPEVDLVVVAAMGATALRPTLKALEAGKAVAVATKEVLVMAGELVRDRLQRHGGRLFPIDSEHSAIWQCLWGESDQAVRRIILTGSGGPLLRRPMDTLGSVTIEEALAHPRWKMGKKITIDSATMMNKGLEILEAHVLFQLPFSAIDVILHPQSVVHSLVEFVDGSVKAQLGIPDMHLPIAIALAYPDRVPAVVPAPDLAAVGALTFEELDPLRFPAVSLARAAGERGGTAPAILNAANEVAVQLYLDGVIRFPEIVALVEEALTSVPVTDALELEPILESDEQARLYVNQRVHRLRPRGKVVGG